MEDQTKVKGIGPKSFPKQGFFLGERVKVAFDETGSASVFGTVVRDDIEIPHVGIIRLDDGRHVLMTECYYMPADESKADG